MLKGAFLSFGFHMANSFKFRFGVLKFNLPDLGEKIK